MSDIVAIVLFLATVIALCAGLLLFGRWLSRRIAKAVVWPSPPAPPTWREWVVIAAHIGLFLAIATFRLLFPENAFSKWIATPKGIGLSVVAYFTLLWITGIVFAVRYLRRAKRA